MKRQYPARPLVGVGGIVFHRDQVLLIKRKNPPGQGIWSIPGGLVKIGEALREAVRREVKEETNLEVRPEEIIEVVERILPDNEGEIVYHYVIVDFLCAFLGGEHKPQSDASDLVWLPFKKLDTLEINEELKNIIEKAYALWRQKNDR
ncbi:MAG: NUDIX hydrolase [Candidatus Desulfofervidaceae bacterium]|nr:NUDIX hydrolase [Candidatus Desulfofervidaceae bacterium]